MTKINKWKREHEWPDWVGDTVEKHSGKPFKGGEKIGIITDMGINPWTGRKAFKIDDDSYVDCYQCKLSDN